MLFPLLWYCGLCKFQTVYLARSCLTFLSPRHVYQFHFQETGIWVLPQLTCSQIRFLWYWKLPWTASFSPTNKRGSSWAAWNCWMFRSAPMLTALNPLLQGLSVKNNPGLQPAGLSGPNSSKAFGRSFFSQVSPKNFCGVLVWLLGVLGNDSCPFCNDLFVNVGRKTPFPDVSHD